MAFRVYDQKEKTWIKDNVYLSMNDDLFILKNNIFGVKKLRLEDKERYIYHRDIDLYDRSAVLIFEGDFVKAKVGEDETVIGVVTFARELSAYVILCNETSKFYTLGTDVCEFVEVVGNVFDGIEESYNGEKPE